MTLRNYEEVAEEFFTELAERGGNRLPALFDELMVTRVFKSACESGVTADDNIAKILRGQISICDEFRNRLRMAWEAREAKANAERSDQFQKGGSEESQ